MNYRMIAQLLGKVLCTIAAVLLLPAIICLVYRESPLPFLAVTVAMAACGAVPMRFPIVPDDHDALLAIVRQAIESCDAVLVSGGSSAGQKDNTARVLSELGAMLFHGIAVKPGKPTMCADVQGKPAFGLPGHPVAAYFMFLELVKPLLLGKSSASASATARLSAGVPSNHGRTELVAVRLEQQQSVERVCLERRGSCQERRGVIPHLPAYVGEKRF